MARVLITGSADGLGRLTAKTLLADGHEVVVHARNTERLAAVRDLIDHGAEAVVGNLSDPEQTRDLATEVNRLGRMNAVIHNAGVSRGRDHPGLYRPPDDPRPAPAAAQRLIRRAVDSQHYELTDDGRKIAVFFTKTYTRILSPSLPELDPALPDEIAQRSPLARAWRAFEHALDARIAAAQLTA